MLTIILLSVLLLALQWFLYRLKAGRLLLFILPTLSICIQIAVIFSFVRQQALVTSSFPLWIRIIINLLPLLISLIMMIAIIVRKYMKIEYTKPFRHTVIRLFICFMIGMLIILLGTVYLAQEYVIFYPNENSEDTDYLMQSSNYTRVNINNKYKGWATEKDESEAIIVYFGGNAQNTSNTFHTYGEDDIFKLMNDYTFLSVDYPTYGDSEGDLSQTELFEMADAVMKYTQRHYPNKKIYIIGYSIGTGIASYAAATFQPDKFVLISPYNNGNDLFNSYLPVFYGPLKYLIRYTLPSDDYVKQIKCNSLIVYSEQDTIVKAKLTKKLINSFKEKPNILKFEKYSHGDMVTEIDIWKDIIKFLK